MGAGVEGAHAGGGLHAQPEGGVHGHGHAHEVGARGGLVGQRLHRQVEGAGGDSGPAHAGEASGHARLSG
ncbi:MAG: hypothetical protein HY784_07950 [Chloroflexi bacterium]|nr:hypothetical protein [Chloroflexota bacterium]